MIVLLKIDFIVQFIGQQGRAGTLRGEGDQNLCGPGDVDTFFKISYQCYFKKHPNVKFTSYSFLSFHIS